MFIGRKTELEELKNLFQKKKAYFVVCMGRRRVGKSTLIQQAGKAADFFYEFQGLHPKEAPTEKDQLHHLSEKIKIYFKRPKMQFTSWTEAFHELNQLLPKGKKTLLFLDEISWMSSGSKTFSSELKDAWDTLFVKNPDLVLAVAGSVSSWIEENILQNANFLGRVSLQLNLDELPLKSLKAFWGTQQNTLSNYDFLKIVSVFGGIPRYLEEINPKESPDQNIHRTCFKKSGFLSNEFEKIFTDIFNRRGPIYKRIVSQLIETPLNITDLAKKLGTEKSGSLSRYLDDLVHSGFLHEDAVFDLTGKQTKFSKFRLKDNYLRFALKYIEPNKKKITDDYFQFSSMDQLPGWKTIIGLQFENLILNNRWIIVDQLGLSRSQVLVCSPYFQKKTTKNKGGCQIDLMIVTKDFQIYICEIKFTSKIPSQVFHDMDKKIHILKRPKHYTVHPVLIYAGELPKSIDSLQNWEFISIDDLV